MVQPMDTADVIKEMNDTIDLMSNQLCKVIDGDFSITVTVDTRHETLQKQCMLINFVLDTARKSLEIIDQQKKELEVGYENTQKDNETLRQEIKLREEAETKLADLHKKMLSVSRTAGMAEVATSILHNVGNVLNSVTTSAELIINQFNESRLKRAVTLIPDIEKSTSIADFLKENANAEKIITYLIKTIKELDLMYDNQMQETSELKNNIEHIRSIIQSQQATAKKVSFTEKCNLPELIKDAFILVKNSYDAHDIDMEFGSIYNQEIETDKHKILQIFTNLLTNSKDALKDLDMLGKKVTVFTEQDDDAIVIHFVDNGCGIEKENLPLIFKHGYTTKVNGHGFGLHSSANAATELKGNLAVNSEGIGHGAIFSLRLPLTQGKGD